MKFICAPMATISHPASRIMIEKFGGCDEYYNEMINAPSLLHGGPFEKYYIDPTPVPEKMVWQLTGKDVLPMVEAANVLCKLPGIAIDLNMGCCAPEIVRSGAGIAWMLKNIEETKALVKDVGAVVKVWNAACALNKEKIVREGEIVRENRIVREGEIVRENRIVREGEIVRENRIVREGGAVRESKVVREGGNDNSDTNSFSSRSAKILSVKMRLGPDDFTDSGFFSFCDMLVSSGVKRITLHPRTQHEKYRDRPRYEYVEELCKRYKGEGVEIILNGDIKDRESLFKALSKAPSVDGVMVGRAAVSKPWIFKELKEAWISRERGLCEGEKIVSGGADFCEGENSFSGGAVSCEGENFVSGRPDFCEGDETSCEIGAFSREKGGTSSPSQPLFCDALTLALSYIDDVMRYQPEEFWKTRLQRFFTYYSENFSFAHYFKSSLLNASSPQDAKERLEEYFRKVPSDLPLKIY